MTVAVPDEHIGAVVGRGGRTITELQQIANVRIKISDRNDYVAGTRNRKVTITGTPDAVQVAHFLVAQKVSVSVAEYAAKAGGGPSGGPGGPESGRAVGGGKFE